LVTFYVAAPFPLDCTRCCSVAVTFDFDYTFDFTFVGCRYRTFTFWLHTFDFVYVDWPSHTTLRFTLPVTVYVPTLPVDCLLRWFYVTVVTRLFTFTFAGYLRWLFCWFGWCVCWFVRYHVAAFAFTFWLRLRLLPDAVQLLDSPTILDLPVPLHTVTVALHVYRLRLIYVTFTFVLCSALIRCCCRLRRLRTVAFTFTFWICTFYTHTAFTAFTCHVWFVVTARSTFTFARWKHDTTHVTLRFYICRCTVVTVVTFTQLYMRYVYVERLRFARFTLRVDLRCCDLLVRYSMKTTLLRCWLR